MAYRIEGEFDGPLLPEIERARAYCKTCGPSVWQREDIYLTIKQKALGHLKKYPTHIIQMIPDKNPPYEWKHDVKPDCGDKPPF